MSKEFHFDADKIGEVLRQEARERSDELGHTIARGVRRLKQLADLRVPPYDLPADSFLEDAVRDILSATAPIIMTEVIGQDGRPVAAPCAIDGCQFVKSASAAPPDDKSQTPRTDGLYGSLLCEEAHHYPKWEDVQRMATLARQLERELNVEIKNKKEFGRDWIAASDAQYSEHLRAEKLQAELNAAHDKALKARKEAKRGKCT